MWIFPFWYSEIGSRQRPFGLFLDFFGWCELDWLEVINITNPITKMFQYQKTQYLNASDSGAQVSCKWQGLKSVFTVLSTTWRQQMCDHFKLMANGFLPLRLCSDISTRDDTQQPLLCSKKLQDGWPFQEGLHISNVRPIGIFILMGEATFWQQHPSLSVMVSRWN